MKARRNSGRGSRGGDHGAHWISYSDMMASLLLVFVLAVVYSVYQYYHMLAIKTDELNAQKADLDRAQIALVQREEELETAQVKLKGKEEELAAIQIQLDQQENELHAAQAALKTKEEEQALLQLRLEDQATVLSGMETTLRAQQAELLNYQKKIDAMLGVRTQIIRDLTWALKSANLSAKVDETTGDIMLESKVFFDSNAATIKDEGKELLERFLPVYLGVLMRSEYRDYVGAIIIEGHTDSDGTYQSNLRLSQNRALAVAEYCLQLSSLTYTQQTQLQGLLSATGRSENDLIFRPDGTEDKEASRRVEFKFRLKDAEMIQEMNRVLTQMEQGGSY